MKHTSTIDKAMQTNDLSSEFPPSPARKDNERAIRLSLACIQLTDHESDDEDAKADVKSNEEGIISLTGEIETDEEEEWSSAVSEFLDSEDEAEWSSAASHCSEDDDDDAPALDRINRFCREEEGNGLPDRSSSVRLKEQAMTANTRE